MQINVTKPFIPPQEEYNKYLEGVWKRGWLTNNGPLVIDLEARLKKYLDVTHINYVNNGTVALQIALRALEIKGEVITTPFSYVATTFSLLWENCTPVFADIDPETFNVDPDKIEELITPETKAILTTHVYGNPCEIEKIEAIAQKHGLKVIYDAAHCFGTKYKGKSVFEYGDISATSFHTTKVFHTVEGGAVFTKDDALHDKMSYQRNFGHIDSTSFEEVGINAKNSEFHAAMGLAYFKYIDNILASRKSQAAYYSTKLEKLNIQSQRIHKDADYNHAYYPIVFESEEALLKSVKALNKNYIFPRRYFYPSLNKLEQSNGAPCPHSESIAKRVLCLPVYYGLSEEEQDMISRILLSI